MKQYLDILNNILESGIETPLARNKMPATLMLPNQHMSFNMADGMPLLTCKEVYVKGAINEILWILRGETNIKSLLDNNCNVWNDNAYKYYLEQFREHLTIKPVSKDQFIQAIKAGLSFVAKYNSDEYLLLSNPGYDRFVSSKYFIDPSNEVDFREPDELDTDCLNHAMAITINKAYTIGDMGRVYGAQWRNWQPHPFTDKGIDQFENLIKGMIKNPYSRYHKMIAWNPSDMPSAKCGQPNCHGDVQITCYPNENGDVQFDLTMIQRSCDYILGVPFNLIHYSVLGCIIEELTGYTFNTFYWHGVNVHVYKNQLGSAIELANRPSLNHKHYLRFISTDEPLTLDGICNLKAKQFKIIDERHMEAYHNQGKIKTKLSVGL